MASLIKLHLGALHFDLDLPCARGWPLCRP